MTKLRLAEQIRLLLGNKPSYQELMLIVNQAFAQVVMSNWWSNRNQGELDTINGNFIYAFDDNDIILDIKKKLYYSVLPSSFLGNIPHEMGIPFVGYMESLDKQFIRLSNGMPALFQGLQSSNFDGYDTFFVENDKVYLPSINTSTACDKKLLIKLVVALDGIDEQTNISIPPDIEYAIINLSVQLYSQKQNDNPLVSATVEQGKKP